MPHTYIVRMCKPFELRARCSAGQQRECKGDGFCWSWAELASMGVLENAAHPTIADYHLHDSYLKAKQRHGQPGHLDRRFAVPHQFACNLFVSERIPLRTVYISTHFIVYTPYLNTLHFKQFISLHNSLGTVQTVHRHRSAPPLSHLLSTDCSRS